MAPVPEGEKAFSSSLIMSDSSPRGGGGSKHPYECCDDSTEYSREYVRDSCLHTSSVVNKQEQEKLPTVCFMQMEKLFSFHHRIGETAQFSSNRWRHFLVFHIEK